MTGDSEAVSPLAVNKDTQYFCIKALILHLTIGIELVGIGSDFDGGGGLIEINDVSQMPI